jgi:hypothetical protein
MYLDINKSLSNDIQELKLKKIPTDEQTLVGDNDLSVSETPQSSLSAADDEILGEEEVPESTNSKSSKKKKKKSKKKCMFFYYFFLQKK